VSAFPVRTEQSAWAISIPDGSLEALKWVAVLAMVADHTNRAWAGETLHSFAEFGRLAFPLFGFVFGYNLARTHLARIPSIITRLTAFGALAMPCYIVALEIWAPLNVLFTFALSAALVWLDRKYAGWTGWIAVLAALVIGGIAVDYFWFGPLYAFASYRWAGKPSMETFLAFLAALGVLAIITVSWTCYGAMALILLSRRFDFGFVRQKWFFYGFYPVHLAILAAGRLGGIA
jgi:hypothetical protein